MNKNLQISTLFCCILFFFLLFPMQGSAFNDVMVLQGRIVSVNKQNSSRYGNGSFTNYILRIRRTSKQQGAPLFLTAEIAVKKSSLNDEIIRIAHSKGNICQFSLSKKGMRYYVHEIFLLEGKSFGKNITPEQIYSSISLSDKAVLYDKKKNTIINTRETIKDGAVKGNSGVSIGDQ